MKYADINDNILSIMINLPQDESKAIAARAKAVRLQQNITQEGLAKRSGVSFGSIKRFEQTGQISLEALLKIAFTLNVLDNFSDLFAPQTNRSGQSLDALIASSKKRKRGSKP